FNSGTSTPEIRLDAVDSILFGTDLIGHSDAKVLISYGATMTMVDASMDVGNVTINGGHLVMGAVVDSVRRGATMMAAHSVEIGLWGDLTIDAAARIVTSGAASTIDIDVTALDTIGTIYAGATADSGVLTATGDGAEVVITVADQLSMGTRQAAGVAYGGNIRATGDITLNGGAGSGDEAYPGTGLWVDARSTVESMNVAGDGAGTVTLNTQRNMMLNGYVLAKGAGGVVDINAGKEANISGVITGHTSVDISGGQTDSFGFSVQSSELIYRMNREVLDATGAQVIAANTYFVDEDGYLMASDLLAIADSAGDLIQETTDADGQIQAAVAAAGATSVSTTVTGTPIRITGAVIDTGEGGSIRIEGTGLLDLNGNIGQLAVGGVANPATVEIESLGTAQMMIRADVHARTLIDISGQDLNLIEGAYVRATDSSGRVNMIAEGNVLIQSQQLSTSALTNA
ncbi:MAG: hypothetical protein VX878_15295, partial [Pseudomonadota bacterium]|nr:hypothetical protein [Pseudomonadota bacterium]